MSVQIDWVTALPVASAIIALGSMLFSLRSSQIARNSLKLTQRSAQTAYEMAKADPRPAVSMEISEIEYRLTGVPLDEEESQERPNLLEVIEKRFKLTQVEGVAADDSLEVVVRGSLTNNTSHDILLTHKPFGREWINRDGECAITFARGRGRLLGPGFFDDFECVIRRSASSWHNVNKRLTRKRFSRHFEDRDDLPRGMRWIGGLVRDVMYFFKYCAETERCEFMFVCDPRFTERVATVWRAEVRRTPLLAVASETGESVYTAFTGRLSGPFDDSTLLYRGEFDSTLAQIKPSKFAPAPPGSER